VSALSFVRLARAEIQKAGNPKKLALQKVFCYFGLLLKPGEIPEP
jgi:hypothetical protein